MDLNHELSAFSPLTPSPPHFAMPKRVPPLISLTLALALSLVPGCGTVGPATYPVAGNVTFDGAPVKEGDILFVPTDPSLAPEGGKIVDGVYRMVSKAGSCRVQISALDIGPDTEWISGSPIASNFIPHWYNDDTILTAEVVARRDNRFDFALSSQPPDHSHHGCRPRKVASPRAPSQSIPITCVSSSSGEQSVCRRGEEKR